MTDSNGFADRDRIDLTKGPGNASGHYTAPLPSHASAPELPEAGSDFWQPYSPYVDPLASLDPAYPPYPVAYPQTLYPTGQYAQARYYANPYLMAPQHVMVRPRSNAMATGALIASLVAYPAMFFCFAGALIAPVSVVLGVIALNQIKDRPYESGEGQAWSGIILGGLLTVLCVGLAAAWVALIAG
ncbi:DUF4190 domain-containing protein [Nocardia sp. 348MFTsu5.1]|uniref:DUF4190 domain-containing protein n=1 Tax=Nocardia sp. 348MFTsu5.1 TaxID=1172185 RepID=UPI00036680F8|nr:DUF4190 domain-containing protein [Nocardia sp. 348MFTsu5.1]